MYIQYSLVLQKYFMFMLIIGEFKKKMLKNNFLDKIHVFEQSSTSESAFNIPVYNN